MVVLSYVGIVLVMMLFERSLVYHPRKYPDGVWNLPGLNFEDAWFTAADGTKLHGWYVHSDQPRAVILHCHGNGGNLTHRANVLRMLHDDEHASAMIFDYRGYGRSEGSPDEAGILEDARAARAWLAKRERIDERQIVMWGESLGGGVAVDLAATDGARGLILEDTFSSLPDVAASHFPWLPVRLLMRNRLDSIAKIGNYHGPLLQVHGDHDHTVPFASGQRLFAAANEPKKFVVVQGGDHMESSGNRGFQESLDKFIGDLH